MRIPTAQVPILLLTCLIAFQGGLGAGAVHHPAPGTSLVRFGQLDAGIYKGSKPKREADFQFLKAHHVRYILQVNFLPFLSSSEKRKARRYGMTFLSVPMNASPFQPSERHVHHVLCILHDRRFHPIYFHCDIGRDRTSLIAGLYDLYFKEMSAQDAWHQAKEYGFKESWTLRGLKAYFQKEAKRVEQARAQRQGLSICGPHPTEGRACIRLSTHRRSTSDQS